jgi:hypothetical protein
MKTKLIAVLLLLALVYTADAAKRSVSSTEHPVIATILKPVVSPK